MKLSISTLGCPGWGLDRIIDMWSALGVEGIEVRGIGNVMNADEIPEFSPENGAATLSKLSEHGLKPIGFGTSANFHDRSKHEEKIKEATTAIDVCQRLAIPFIRVFGNNVSQEDPHASLAAIIDGLSQVCAYGEKKGVGVHLEIHGDINTPERLRIITEAMAQYPSFGIIWDVYHSFAAVGNDFDELYGVIRPYVRHVHIKDCRTEEGKLVQCSVGEGEIDIGAVVHRLLDDGYDGYFSLEHEKKWHPSLAEPEDEFPRFVRYMKSL